LLSLNFATTEVGKISSLHYSKKVFIFLHSCKVALRSKNISGHLIKYYNYLFFLYNNKNKGAVNG